MVEGRCAVALQREQRRGEAPGEEVLQRGAGRMHHECGKQGWNSAHSWSFAVWKKSI